MKLPAKCVAGLLPLVLAGCVHKSNQVQVQPPLAPPILDSPPVKTAPPTDLPPPVVTAPKQTPAETASTQPPPPPAKPKHRRPPAKPAEQAASTPQPSGNTQEVAKSDGSAVSAIGQLSTGDEGDMRTQTENSISATERGLREIGRKLNEQEQKTADQIADFLKEARKALTTGDVDGAQTLAAKAKVLLGELTK